MSLIEKLLSAERPFLTDGGFETSLFFKEGFDAPAFAAIVLMDDREAVAAMTRYFEGFLEMAQSAGVGFVLDTNSWRGCVHWAGKLGRSAEDMLRLNREAAELALGLRERWRARVSPIIVNGVVGPAGDGYSPEQTLQSWQAQAMHAPQIEVFRDAGVDMISAITMTHPGEAIGVAKAAQAAGLPVVISFTVETDGCLPTGETLGDAIAAVDDATDSAPLYYMVNCAHPDHFHGALAKREKWLWRIGGLRANASRLSHAELDAATELDEGNPEEFGKLHGELAELLPNLRVVGGCCGTDHRHVARVSERLHAELV